MNFNYKKYAKFELNNKIVGAEGLDTKIKVEMFHVIVFSKRD